MGGGWTRREGASAYRLVVGLGNPGERYQATRHNAGFRALDHLVRRLDGYGPVEMCRARVLRAHADGIEWILAYPLTYMNASGEAVACLVRRLSLHLDEILVIYDDMALPPGRIRVRGKGSSGAHKGMQSIIDHLGTDRIARVRIGIGEPPPGVAGAEWVLEVPDPEQAARINEAARLAAEAAEVWGRLGIEAAMNRFNAMTAASDGGRPETT
ncbi:MAG TPA: aminoacyl-tRNA hydrolase [Limnochordales bacterium]